MEFFLSHWTRKFRIIILNACTQTIAVNIDTEFQTFKPLIFSTKTMCSSRPITLKLLIFRQHLIQVKDRIGHYHQGGRFWRVVPVSVADYCAGFIWILPQLLVSLVV